MTNKGSNQNGLSKRQKELMARFRMSYERLSYNQRRLAQKSFCQIHLITPGTFRNKLNGYSTLSETETEWMEQYNPYAQAA